MSDAVWRRLQLLIGQGVGTLIGAKFVQADALTDEPLPKVHRVEPYGLSYRAKPGCEVYMVFPGGDRAEGIALVIGDKRYQMDLLEGEVALHDDEGNFVKLGRNGIVTVKASTKVIADTPLFQTTGDVEIGGRLKVAGGADIAGGLTNNGVSVGEEHDHTSTLPGTPTSSVNR